MACKNMNFEDADADFDPEFAEFAAARRPLKTQAAMLSTTKQSWIVREFERLPFCERNGIVQQYCSKANERISLVPPLRLFIATVVLGIACVCFMSSSIRGQAEIAVLKGGIQEMALALQSSADQSLVLDMDAASLSERLKQQNSRLASVISDNKKMREELDVIHASRKVCSDEVIAMTGMLKQKLTSLIEEEEALLLNDLSPPDASSAKENVRQDALPSREDNTRKNANVSAKNGGAANAANAASKKGDGKTNKIPTAEIDSQLDASPVQKQVSEVTGADNTP